MKKQSQLIDAIFGTVVSVVGGVVLVAGKLLPYNEFTQEPIILGGVFGVLVSFAAVIKLKLRATLRIYICGIAGILGVSSAYWFNRIVLGEMQFPGRVAALYALSFLLFACLLFLATYVYTTLAPGGKPRK